MPAYDAYVFDLDGTLYLGDELLPGAAETVRALRERGALVRFVSNNVTRSPRQYVDKLTRLGIEVDLAEILTPTVTTVRWLQTNEPDAVVFPIAPEPVVTALTEAGIAVGQDPEVIDIVLASYDRSFSYSKLQIAFDAIWYHRRARLMSTNPDRFCPYPGGRGEPDAAAIVAAIEASTGATCERTFGKPDPAVLELALAGTEIPLHRVLMVGDRLATDIAMGVDAGAGTALVLTGDSTAAEAADLDPDRRPRHVLDGVAGIL
ncbi:HAD-IIA family hydrolase [Pseudactinotalea terrae]|uniref:HAD-IIA family hydrolase n=1 Tax=Pseudactinotalea terrae TaxID=1743262 RepID=UPI0012E2F192|nr:HAD-IIA family hydrolase [Pseudactinotalea terrae]